MLECVCLWADRVTDTTGPMDQSTRSEIEQKMPSKRKKRTISLVVRRMQSSCSKYLNGAPLYLLYRVSERQAPSNLFTDYTNVLQSLAGELIQRRPSLPVQQPPHELKTVLEAGETDDHDEWQYWKSHCIGLLHGLILLQSFFFLARHTV